MSDNTNTEHHSEVEEEFGGPVFEPRLYIQRYYFVQQELIKHKVSSVVDFGSAECKICKFLVRIPSVERVALVDIDKTLLEDNKYIIRPLASDYLCRRELPLAVKMYCGSVTDYDQAVAGFEAVTMVEIIEHLLPDTLARACEMVFGKLQPRIVVMTTPNSDFNILFPGMTGFRHYDHKFEWTRQEFQEWCNGLTEQFPYTVEYDGVGDPPSGSQHLGHCSQAAVFVRKTEPAETDSKTSDTYQLVAECVYPHKEASGLTEEEETLMELEFLMRQHSLARHPPAETDIESSQSITQCSDTTTSGASHDLVTDSLSLAGAFQRCVHCNIDNCKRQNTDSYICATGLQKESCGCSKENTGDVNKTEENISKDIPGWKDSCVCTGDVSDKAVECLQHTDPLCQCSCMDKQTDSYEDSGLGDVSDNEKDTILICLTDLLKQKLICSKFDQNQLRAFLLKHGYRLTGDQSCVVWHVDCGDKFSDCDSLQGEEEEECSDSVMDKSDMSVPSCNKQTVSTGADWKEESWDSE